MEYKRGLPNSSKFAYSPNYPPLCFLDLESEMEICPLAKPENPGNPSVADMESTFCEFENHIQTNFHRTSFHSSTKSFYKTMNKLTAGLQSAESPLDFIPSSRYAEYIPFKVLGETHLDCGMTLAEFSLFLLRHLHRHHSDRNKAYRGNLPGSTK
mgnify:CR=1 FL=1